MIIAGVILLIIAAICYFIARGHTNQLRAMSATETYTAQSLLDLHTRVVDAIGADALAEPCEVEGVIECDTPLTAPISGTTCVAYTRTVTREYEEDVTSTNQEGKTETRTERRSATEESEDRRVNFWVRDTSGRVLVSPENAELDLVETANRFDAAFATGGRVRTLGRRYQERALAVGTQVYILGCVSSYQGQPIVGRNPRNPGQKVVISRRSERELTASATSSARNFTYAAIGFGALGAVLLLIGLVS